jgi:hypothetical protein
MAKPNYSFEKRQRELARKKKQEEKRSRHVKPKTADDGSSPEEPPVTPAVTPVVSTPEKPAVG